MHRALQIEEILLNIFGHCHTRYETVVSEMAPLARTCRTFKEPALDVLWAELPDLSPLVRCLHETSHELPRDEPSIAPVYSFSRPLTQTDWDVLRRYTSRTRSILSFGHELDQRSLSMLSNPPVSDPLFPNLRFLGLSCIHMPHFLPLVQFHFRSLISFHICYANTSISRDFLESLPDFFPNIRKAFIEVVQPNLVFDKRVSGSICRWRNLRSVWCPDISLNTDALAHLSYLPALYRLEFVLDTGSLPSDSILYFSHLRHLLLRSDSLGRISSFLPRIRLPVIAAFSAIIHNLPSRREVLLFLASLRASGASDTLENFMLCQSRNSESIVRMGPSLTLEDFQPCMAFGNLVCLEYEVECSVTLTDSDLRTLALAWPRLKRLSINSASGWNSPGGITPDGLLQLLQTCRFLAEIALVIDARGYTRFLLDRSFANLGLALPPTFHVDVLDSTIEAESVLPLVAFFAGLGVASCFDVSFRAWECWKCRRPRGWRAYQKRWNTVFRRASDVANRRFIDFRIAASSSAKTLGSDSSG